MKNTAVYVSQLPSDVTIDELSAHFSRAGIIMDDMVSGGPRIKIYSSHDALVVYLREESVELACQLLDESPLRPGSTIRVEPARFDKTDECQTTNEQSTKRIDKETWRKKMGRMQSKLAWEEEGAAEIRAVEKRLRFECTALLYKMFTREQIKSDPTLFLDIEEDVREEAGKLGAIRSVNVLDDQECIAVKFVERESASNCIQLMNGRWYCGRQIVACLYDGSFKIKGQKLFDDEHDEEERLERFGSWLEDEHKD